MGQKDYAQSGYFSDKVRFADVCNGILFQGKEYIRPEDLSYEKQFKTLEREYRHQGLIGEKENLAWSELAKKARFVPVILIVIYYGLDKAWDGAKCLFDMLNMDEELEPYVTNYKMNLFDYHDYEDFSFFKTENRELFEILSCAKDEKKMNELLMENLDRYKHLAVDAVETIFTLTGIDLSILDNIKDEEAEVVDMCKALDDHKEAGRQEGICTSIKNLMTSTKVSAQQAMEMLQISETDWDMYLGMLG